MSAGRSGVLGRGLLGESLLGRATPAVVTGSVLVDAGQPSVTITGVGNTPVTTPSIGADGGWDGTIDVPAGVTAGSLVVAALTPYWNTTSVPTSAAVIPPAGWNLGSFYTFYDVENGAAIVLAYYYHYATGSESGTYDFTYGSVGGESANTYGIAFTILDGPTSGNPFTDTPHNGDVTSGDTETISTFTPGGDNSLLIGLCGSDGGSAFVYPSGWSIAAENAGNGVAVGSVQQTAAAATGSLAFTLTGGNWMGTSVVTIRVGVPAFTGTVLVDAGSPSVAVTGHRTAHGSIAFDGTPSISVTGQRTTHGSVLVSATGAITVTGLRVIYGSVGVSGGTPVLEVTGQRTVHGSSSISASGSITVIGSSGGTGTLVVSATDSLSVAGQRTVHGSVGLAGTIALTVTGQRTVLGSVAVTETSAIEVTGLRTGHGLVVITSTPGLAITGHRRTYGSALVTGSATIAFKGYLRGTGSAEIGGHLSITVTGHRRSYGSIALSGTSELTVTGIVSRAGSLEIEGGTPSIVVTGQRTVHGSAGISTTASITITGLTEGFGAVTVVTTGTISVTGHRAVHGSAQVGATAIIVITVLRSVHGSLTLKISTQSMSMTAGPRAMTQATSARNSVTTSTVRPLLLKENERTETMTVGVTWPVPV